MTEKQTEYLFRPVRCLEEALSNITPLEGSLYFTLDTQKIFLAKDNALIQMCESKGFYYGIKEIEYDNSGNDPDPQVDFYLNEIESNKLPEVDDLILNKDGCFYRVLEILDEETVRTNRLTLQGTGGGGGTEDATSNLRISAPNGLVKYFSKEAERAIIDVIAFSSDTTNYISSVECSFDSNFESVFYSQFNLTYPLETPYEVDIVNALDKMSATGTKIFLRLQDKYGSSRSITYTVSVPSLLISTNHKKLFGASGNEMDYICIIGGSNSLSNRTISYTVYDSFNVEKSLGTFEVGTSTTITKSLKLSELAHGEYTLKVQAYATVGGTTVYSNVLTHKLLRYDEEVAQPIFSALIPEKTEQYSDITISYLLYFGVNTKQYKVDFVINNKIETTQILTAGTIDSYTLNFDNIGSYDLSIKINELGIEYNTILNIVPYTGNLPFINIDDDALKVYLTAKGRTNNAADKEYWPDYKNSTMKGVLSNFYYRTINGWMIDENDIPFLRVSQGAIVEFNEYSPYSENPKNKGITIELDFKLSGILNYSEEQARLIECLSYDNNGKIKTGFFVTGDKFKYYASGKELVSLDLVADQRIRLTQVIEASNSQEFPMCYTYLNGILSNVYNYKNSDDFTNSSAYPGYLKINSKYGQIDVYNIRFYSVGFNSYSVLYNYQAGLTPLELRQENYEDNLVYNSNNEKISLEQIESDNYNLKIPYVKITGGYLADNNEDMRMTEKNKNPTAALPNGKKNYRLIDIEIHYPTAQQNAYFAGWPREFKVTTTFEDTSLNVLNGFGQIPIKAAVMYAQGTSSLEYPVKNLRVKFKDDVIKVRPDLEPVNLICFKADYMESSGSHNTGASNYIDAAYKAIKISTPGQDHYDKEHIVTCIKGHPCIIFWSPTGEPGSYEYIGKYNLNLDKATPEPFGFKNDDTNFGYETNINGDLVLDDKGNKINSIYCFEFLDNNEKVCNFLSDEKSGQNPSNNTESKRYYDTWYGDRINKDNKVVPGWALGFESRYPEDKKGKTDADALWPLASWLNELYEIYQNELTSGLKPSDIDYVYSYELAKEYDSSENYYELGENGEYKWIGVNEDNFVSNTYYTRTLVSTHYKMTSLYRFRNEYQEYLDPEFLLAYYIITEALLMADSRVKNMMIATWGKEHRTFTLEDGSEKSVFNYIWYPIFYDMDTMLGLDNTGHANKYYYDEDTIEEVFNGDEVLWKLVRDALPNELNQFYSRLEQTSGFLTKDGILPYFNDNQANMANESFYNEDAIYKYITPFRVGYKDDLNNKEIAPGTGERLYAAQGDRSMMREYFIESRLRYLRGKRSSTGYQAGDRIEFRVTYPKEAKPTADTPLTEEQIKTNASILAVPPSGNFNLTSLRTGYAGIKIGANVAPVNARFVNQQEQNIQLDTSGANGTEAYILGASNLSSVGDLSDKYIYNLIVGTSDNNLKSLLLGNHEKNYYNPFWSGTKDLNLANFTYLEEFNFENCGSFTGALILKNCAQAKTIKANGSSATSIELPVQGVLEELRIPATVTDLSIDSHPTLKADKFTIGSFDYDTNSYVNDYSKLVHVNIIDTPIDSYNLIKKALKINEVQTEGNRSVLESFCLQGINWKIEDPEDVEINNQNEIIGIKVLDLLSNINPYINTSNLARADRLIGKIHVDVGNYIIDEFTLYNKYQKIFPNVTLLYTSTGLKEAYHIKFYNSENIMGEPYYTVLTNGEMSLNYLTGINSPTGSALSEPIKPSTNQYDYKFNNKWTVAQSDDSVLVGKDIMVSEFETIIPKGNTSFTANYDSIDRKYSILLYDDDGVTVLLKEELNWEDDIGEKLSKYTQLTYNYKPYLSVSANPHNRWTFDGWQNTSDFNGKESLPTWTSLKGVLVQRDFIAYAHYKEENAKNTETNIEYFTIDNNVTINGYTGLSIRIKNEYRQVLSGKITLPSKFDGYYISSIGDCKNLISVEDIYFLEDNQYRGIINGGGFAMTENSKLKNVYLPKTEYFTYLGDNAFENCVELINITDDNTNKLNDNIIYIGTYCFGFNSLHGSNISKKAMQVNIHGLPVSLKTIRNQAFYSGGEGNRNIIITSLPLGVEELTPYCLAACPSVAIVAFGTNEGNGLKIIHQAALLNSGENVPGFTLYSSIEALGVNGDQIGIYAAAFTGYAKNATRVTSYKNANQIYNTSKTNRYTLTSFSEAGIDENKVTIEELISE